MIGNASDALEAQMAPYLDDLCSAELIGRGESRRVYLVNGVAYKVGSASANEYEHQMLTAWREAGAGWAPETSLWTGRDSFGDHYTIIAMEYLPDDGSEPDGDTLAEIRAVAPQTCSENLHMCGGQLYLIDGVDVEVLP